MPDSPATSSVAAKNEPKLPSRRFCELKAVIKNDNDIVIAMAVSVKKNSKKRDLFVHEIWVARIVDLPLDVKDYKSLVALLQAVLRGFGKVDILVISSGAVAGKVPSVEVREEDLLRSCLTETSPRVGKLNVRVNAIAPGPFRTMLNAQSLKLPGGPNTS